MADRERRTDEESVRRSIDAVWRIESAKIVATLARYTGDLPLAEDLASDALADALEQWPSSGIPSNPAAWLTHVAKRKAIDGWRRDARLAERVRTLGRDLERDEANVDAPWDPDEIADDVMRLLFTACHPVLNESARVALTLRVVGGLSTKELARVFLVPVATMQQRIVRAKQALAAAGVPFETPTANERPARLASVLGVIYLIFTEGHTVTGGADWMRPDLSREAVRLARVLTRLAPKEPEAFGLLALVELTSARFAARLGRDGEPVLLQDQDRTRWDRDAIRRGRSALRTAESFGRGLGYYGLQAAIAECHAVAGRFEATDWTRIVALYDGLAQLAPSPVVHLNRAVAVSYAVGPSDALAIVDELAEAPAFRLSHLLPSVRGELLARLGRDAEAREEFALAARRTENARERAVLLAKASVGG